VTVEYYYNYCIPRYPLSCFLFKTSKVSKTRLCLRLQMQLAQLSTIDRAGSYLLKPTRYRMYKPSISQPSARVKTNINIDRSPHLWDIGCVQGQFHGYCWNDCGVRIEVIGKETKISARYQHKTQFSHIMWDGLSRNSAVIMGVQKGEMSKWSWLMRWSSRDTWANPYISCRWCLDQSVRPLLLSNTFCSWSNIIEEYMYRPLSIDISVGAAWLNSQSRWYSL
jgi:hypothetical protein